MRAQWREGGQLSTPISWVGHRYCSKSLDYNLEDQLLLDENLFQSLINHPRSPHLDTHIYIYLSLWFDSTSIRLDSVWFISFHFLSFSFLFFQRAIYSILYCIHDSSWVSSFFFSIDDVALTTRFGFHLGHILEPFFVLWVKVGRKLKVRKPQAVKMQNMTMMVWKQWLCYSWHLHRTWHDIKYSRTCLN